MRSLLVAILCFIATQIALAEEKKVEKPVPQKLVFDRKVFVPDEAIDRLMSERGRDKFLSRFNKLGLVHEGKHEFKEIEESGKVLGWEISFRIKQKIDSKSLEEYEKRLEEGSLKQHLDESHHRAIKFAMNLIRAIVSKGPMEVDGTVKITGLYGTQKPEENRKEDKDYSTLRVKVEVNYTLPK